MSSLASWERLREERVGRGEGVRRSAKVVEEARESWELLREGMSSREGGKGLLS